MLKQVTRTLAIAATIVALVTPVAYAGSSTPTGTDPEPGVVHTILVFLGLA